jgi:hypothetical protein
LGPLLTSWWGRNWIKLALMASSALGILISMWLFRSHHRPPVGIYIAVMGVVIAIMTLREKPPAWEKLLWVVLITILMVVEVRNIYMTDAEQTETFSKIIRDLNSTKQGIDAAAKSIEGSAEALRTLHSEITGGDSYLYFDIGPLMGPVEMNLPNWGGKQNVMWSVGIPKLVGMYSLHDINVFVSDLAGNSETEYKVLNPWVFGRSYQGLYLRFRPEKHRQHVHIWISASNGDYYQGILFLKVNEKWVWSSRFYKGGGRDRKLIREWSDPGLPKSIGADEWNKEGD